MIVIRDYLAVAATKPTLACGVPAKLLVVNISLSILPGIYINGFFFNGDSACALFITWFVVFFTVYRVALFFTRKDVNFIEVFYKSLTRTQRIRNARFWDGLNTYSVG